MFFEQQGEKDKMCHPMSYKQIQKYNFQVLPLLHPIPSQDMAYAAL